MARLVPYSCVQCGGAQTLDLRDPPKGVKQPAPVKAWICPWCFATNQGDAPGWLFQVHKGHPPNG